MDDATKRARDKWHYRGQVRPEFAEIPTDGQETVWDYPRPPRVEADRREVRVLFRDTVIASSTGAVRVMETASPPTFYIPPRDIQMAYVEKGVGSSLCEWKGQTQYWSVRVGEEVFLENVGWSYPEPLAGFESIGGFLSFYPARLTCIVGGEQVHAQPGGFYGGWATSDVLGPFKGAPGTEWW